MKTFTKLVSVAAATVLAGAAYAGDMEAVQIQNAHGQIVTLYRPVESTSVALFVSGRGLGTRPAAENSQTQAAIKQNAHGQSAVQFERGSTR